MKSLTLTIVIILLSFRGFSQKQTQKTNLMNHIIAPLNAQVSSQQFPELPYSFDALEPHFDKLTMEIHYSKHHKAYFNNMIDAVKMDENAGSTSLLSLFKNISKHPIALRNNAGGFYNHLMFWNILSPNSKLKPQGKLLEAILRDFGTFEEFKIKFDNAAKSRFGSGWAWLVVTEDKKLAITSTPNQDNPYMDVSDVKGVPVLALDVWEHAYYLKFQNRRPDYIASFWNVVDWDAVELLFENAL